MATPLNTNPLEEHPKARKLAYQVFWGASLAAGAAQIGFATSNATAPGWLTTVLAVLPFVGAGIGYTASANVQHAPRHA